MQGTKNHSALLAKYFNMYKKNPRSRVFAPLAESYRKLGMLEDAYKILRDGIRHHPTYTLGYVVLAHCYYDEGKFELTYSTLRPIIAQNADNISLQKIFAQACIHLGHLEEALDTFKYLLFMIPKDRFFAEQVKRLEDDLLVGHKKLSLEQLVKAPDLPQLKPTPPAQDEDWVQVDFNRPTLREIPKPLEPVPSEDDAIDDQWVMKKPTLEDHPILKEERVSERSLEDEYYADEFQEEGDIDDVNASSLSAETPIVSHTLIDLYSAQHYYDKAVELLEKILELNPNDVASLQKLQKVKELRQSSAGERPTENLSEEAGHDELISIIESQVKAKSPSELRLEAALQRFMTLVRERAQEAS